ncbi:MAG TPA: PaaI family thioesterase [Candidatus Dormibacteraeota bacterium]|nr:PaaI family thioesterase [Candidatus Dormibacteraeota bacterium]
MSEDFAARLNESPEGWLQAMHVTVSLATKDEVRCELTVGPEHLQGYGIVHGGVHCGLIETLASIGAALYALPNGQHVVGLENNTSFIRAVRLGARLHAIATPITRGRRTQVWEARVLDEQDRAVATGRVRLLCLEPDQALAGQQVRGVLHPEKR